MPNYFNIQEFYGIQQQKDGSLLPPGTAYDARNIDTSDGNLRLAKGFEKFIESKCIGSDKILKLIIARLAGVRKFYIVAADNIYAYVNNAWTSVFTLSPSVSGQVDYLQTKIGEDDYLIVSVGNQQMIKIKLADNTATRFGTGLYTFNGTVAAYDSTTFTVTLSDAMSTDAERHALVDGVTIDGLNYKVQSASGTAVVLAYEPETAPEVGQDATIRGGGSTASCRFVGLYYNRLVCAGDPLAPSRLYWSAVGGNGRTVEDWLSVEGSADASGGYVEVGNSGGDKIVGLCVLSSQILIIKEHSVWRLYGDRPSSFSVERVEDTGENMSNASIVIKYDTPQYLTASGIKYYDGTGILPLNGGQRILDRFVKEIYSVEMSKALHADNVLYFTCKMHEGAGDDDAIICYDIARQSFMIRDGFEVADMIVDDGQIFFINSNRYVYEFLKGYTYDGNPIYAYWNTQPTDLLAKYIKKQIKELMFRGKTGKILFTVRDGATKTYVKRNLFLDNDGYNSVAVSTDLARVFEILIENEEGSYFEITGGLDISYDRELRQK